MSKVDVGIAAMLLGSLVWSQANAEGACSAWAERARIEAQIQLRTRNNLRADPQWVMEIARSPKSKFGYRDILMSPAELQVFAAKLELREEREIKRRDLIEHAGDYGLQHAEQFAGMYLRRNPQDLLEPPTALVVRFTGNLALHQAALQSLPGFAGAGIPLEVLPARFSMKRLETVMRTLGRRYADFSAANGILLIGSAPDAVNNVIKVEAESNLRDAAARLEAGLGGTVQAVIYPMYDDSKWVPVTQGPGWRLLGQSEHRGDAHANERTQAATTLTDWEALKTATRLLEPSRSPDFSKEIVLTFTNSLGCSRSRLDGIAIDTQLQAISAQFSYSGSPRIPCTARPAGFDVFAVAVERAALPANPITVPYHPWPEDLENPTYCPRGLIIPRL